LSETDVSPSKWFPLYRQTVQIHNGKVLDDFFISKLGDAAMVIPKMRDGRFALVRQYKHGASEITIEFPAGRIDQNETPEDAAKREVKEETGIQCGAVTSLGKLFPLPSKDTAKLFGFLSLNCEVLHEVNFDQSEDIETLFRTESEINDMIKHGEINCSDTVGLWMKYRLTYSEM